MKAITAKTLTALTVLCLAVYPATAAQQTLKGVVSDSMCGRKHMMPGKSDAECVRECIKANSKYALVTREKVYTLEGNSAELERLAGKQVQITGDVAGTSVKVSQIAAAQ